ncbi:MAG TPA: serine--tRNA ligase, partial [Candidatus Sabulitectum sp.]|nr:serine--tRNA ligase [Candidatus Sabulitectum sp.]
MLDRKRLRKEPHLIEQAIAAKNEKAKLDLWTAADTEKRSLMLQVENLRNTRNELSRTVAMKKRQGENADLEVEESRKTGEELSALEKRLSVLDEELNAMELSFPNVPDADVPVGGEENNIVMEEGGTMPSFQFQPRPHWELMENVFLPAESGKITGSNFILFRGWAARLQRTLISW